MDTSRVETLGLLVIRKVISEATMITEDSAQRKRQMVGFLHRFIDGHVGEYEWDDFMGIVFSDPFLERARTECNRILEASVSGSMDTEMAKAAFQQIADRLEANTPEPS